jgi:hypothetical protein
MPSSFDPLAWPLGYSFNFDRAGVPVESTDPAIEIERVNQGAPIVAGVPFDVETRVAGQIWEAILPYANGETIGQAWAAAGAAAVVPFSALPEGVHTVMVEMYRSEPYASVVSTPLIVQVRSRGASLFLPMLRR